MAFYELRQYKVLPGKLDEWVKIMEEEIIPFQVSKGMVITGSFRGETDESKYVWLRRFESEAEREALSALIAEEGGNFKLALLQLFERELFSA